MKKTIFLLIFIFLLFNTVIPVLAVDEADVKVQLDKAWRIIYRLKNNKKLSDYIPFSFSDAIKYYEKAKTYLKNSDEEDAFYYAHISEIEALISETKAKTRMVKFKTVGMEKKYYYNIATSNSKDRIYNKRITSLEYKLKLARLKIKKLKNSFNDKLMVIKAGFKKDAYGLKIILSNSSLFVRGTSSLTRKAKNKLMIIAKVAKLFKGKKILVETHKNYRDWRNRYTKKTLSTIKDFLIKACSIAGRRILGTAYGNTKRLVRWGSANDRVEIIIQGAKF